MKIDIGTFQLKNGREGFPQKSGRKGRQGHAPISEAGCGRDGLPGALSEEITKTVEEEAYFCRDSLLQSVVLCCLPLMKSR